LPDEKMEDADCRLGAGICSMRWNIRVAGKGAGCRVSLSGIRRLAAMLRAALTVYAAVCSTKTVTSTCAAFADLMWQADKSP